MMRANTRNSGFTLLELLVVLAIVAISATLGVPSLLEQLKRSKVQMSVRQAALMMQVARAQAGKRGVRTGVTVLYASNEILSFAETDLVPGLSAGDRELARFRLPNGVSLHGPGDIEGTTHNAANWGSFGEGFGFSENSALEGTAFFRPDGSAETEGAFRLKDTVGNYFEIRVAPAATGRVAVRKFRGADPADVNSWQKRGESSGWQWN